jgi:putative selenate reductase molybdopterin-binding subunit
MTPVTQITLEINGENRSLVVTEDQSLLRVLRDAGYFGVKYGCGSGECGMCTVLIDGKPVKSCIVKAVNAEGKKITTIEGLSKDGKLDPVQDAFIETGAMQCGFCSPALILSAKALLDKNTSPTVQEIRKALNPVLCRCTGYVRAVNAVQRAAARIRGENLDPYIHIENELPETDSEISLPEAYLRKDGNLDPLPPLVFSPPSMPKTKVVGKALKKKDANKLAQGKPVYTDDFRLPGMLYGELLTSPHAHARIRSIDASKARELDGVRAVLTFQDIPRIKYASGGQSYPQPLPYDQVSLDCKVRHVGDRVAVVAADTAEIARLALDLIEVDY